MTITELREAFAAWRKAETGQAVLAYNLIWLLTDPTPITEAGLRELGFEPRPLRSWRHGALTLDDRPEGRWLISICWEYREVKSMGKLRCLLLGVGE